MFKIDQNYRLTAEPKYRKIPNNALSSRQSTTADSQILHLFQSST